MRFLIRGWMAFSMAPEQNPAGNRGVNMDRHTTIDLISKRLFVKEVSWGSTDAIFSNG
ncbi:hypothetical protein DESC_730040 [Desulfosarcina cetonica]|nr:hypothetical protein DESC_730040 [Desulfosarcina cetonica]